MLKVEGGAAEWQSRQGVKRAVLPPTVRGRARLQQRPGAQRAHDSSTDSQTQADTHTHTHNIHGQRSTAHSTRQQHGNTAADTAADSSRQQHSTGRPTLLICCRCLDRVVQRDAIEKGSSVMLLTRVPVPQHFMLEVATSHRLTPSLHTYCSRLLTREGGACTWSRQPSRSKLPRPVVTRSLRSRRR